MTSLSHQASVFQDSIHAGFPAIPLPLAQDGTHLKHIFQKSRFRASLVTVHDYDESWNSIKNPVRVDLDFSMPGPRGLQRQFVTSLRSSIAGACKRRVIIVEDSCSEILQELRRAFDLSPEVIEDYLVNSGWDKSDRYDDTELNHWRTRRIEQEHVTLRWYRPCTMALKNLGEPSIELSRDSVLQVCRRELRNIKDDTGRERVKPIMHDIDVATNVWRRHLDLRIHEGGPFREGEPLAWEERVTLWRREEEDGLFVIVLIDPSPLAISVERGPHQKTKKLHDARKYMGTEAEISPSDDLDDAINKLTSESLLSIGGSSVRASASPAAYVHENQPSQIPLPESQTCTSSGCNGSSSRYHSLNDVATSANHTCNASGHGSFTGTPSCTNDATPSQIALPDSQMDLSSSNRSDSIRPDGENRVLTISDKVINGASYAGSPPSNYSIDTNEVAFSLTRSENYRTNVVDVPGGIEPRDPSTSSSDRSASNNSRLSMQGRLQSEISRDPKSRYAFLLRNVASRSPTANISLVPSRFCDRDFEQTFQQTTSTAYDLDLWMKHNNTRQNQSNMGLGPVSTIFNIISNDLEDFLLFYEDFLDGVEYLSLDQSVVEKLLPAWRSLINDVGIELRYLESRLPSFAAFIAVPPTQPPVDVPQALLGVDKTLFDVEGAILPRLLKRIRRLQERTQHSSDALVAAVSFLESRQGIDEARSVTRLTQLAFFFIPISFAASFYGMQVKELVPADTSIWQFFAMTTVLMIVSYTVFYVQSANFKAFVEHLRKEIKALKERSSDVSTGDEDDGLSSEWLLKYAWEKKGLWIGNIAGVLIVIIAIMPIWTSSLARSIRLIISISVLSTSLILLVFIANRKTLQRQIAQAGPRYEWENRKKGLYRLNRLKIT